MNKQQFDSYSIFIKDFVGKVFADLPIAKALKDVYRLIDIDQFENALLDVNDSNLVKLLNRKSSDLASLFSEISTKDRERVNVNRRKLLRQAYLHYYNKISNENLQLSKNQKKQTSKNKNIIYENQIASKISKSNKKDKRKLLQVIGQFPDESKKTKVKVIKKKYPWKTNKDLNIYGIRAQIISTPMKG